MQATMNSSAAALLPRLQFARHGTMVRSEKRTRRSPQQTSDWGSPQPPRRKRPRAGFFYKLLTTLLLLVLWPVGMILLWRKRLRWGSLTKIFVSVVTLMACILLLGTALTIETGNARITAAQNRVISFMDGAVDAISDFSVHLGERAELSLEAISDIRAAYQDQGLLRAADAIDFGVDLAQSARSKVLGWLGKEVEPEQAEETEAPSAPANLDDDLPGEASPEASERRPDASPTGREEEAEATVEPEATSVPAADLHVGAADEVLPVYIPSEGPEEGAALHSGTLLRSGALSTSDHPIATSEPTPEPTPETVSFAVKPSGDAIVYFNIRTGKYYHTASACGSMKSAPEYKFSEVAKYDHQACPNCGAPDKSLLAETYIVWVDENQTAHLTDECESFQGKWSLSSAEAANEAKLVGCPDCGADAYLQALLDGKTVLMEIPPTAITAETPDPNATPAPVVVTPRETLKPAPDIIVYHTDHGKFYHSSANCSGMRNAKPHPLAESVADGFEQCQVCNAPAPDAKLDALLYLWQDEDGLCHVSDECKNFKGEYTLVERNDALEQGLTACTRCGAADYLIPDTEIDPYIFERAAEESAEPEARTEPQPSAEPESSAEPKSSTEPTPGAGTAAVTSAPTVQIPGAQAA